MALSVCKAVSLVPPRIGGRELGGSLFCSQNHVGRSSVAAEGSDTEGFGAPSRDAALSTERDGAQPSPG